MKQKLFQIIASINKAVLPKMYRKDLNRLSKIDKAIIAWKYWVVLQALPEKEVPYGRI